ncbi:N-acetyltransferase [Brevibacterium sp. 50QC2O2]|jgi:predicted GNAT family acetyltransferase|uniref:GNAT family N-acetyltransferase n=1 Tax=Brevibacterium TaxID=1696 RepID=UPI00211CD014|nr:MULTISPECIES: GNAT family N-acetyltransferase [unclassified Brevibacterium]MCQ9385172.1 N-acetyltransferase [Brevibacterium sp. 68QC2CO]MCQ9387795.1 N-acetyltransferase [Brevibacterium sp. 50QC2O2]
MSNLQVDIPAGANRYVGVLPERPDVPVAFAAFYDESGTGVSPEAGSAAGDAVQTTAPAAPAPTTRVFNHTVTVPEFGGRGYAAQVVRAALDDAVARGLRIRSECSYVTHFLSEHHDWDAHLAPALP